MKASVVEPQFTEEELEYFAQDDAIDIKNFGRLEPGTPEHAEMKAHLERCLGWYWRNQLYDWGDSIMIALQDDLDRIRYRRFPVTPS